MPCLPRQHPLILGSLSIAGCGLVLPAQAEVIEDSRLRLDLRNYYFNRDFREGNAQSKREEWAQGFMLRLDSGFTEGSLGFGVDASAMLGLKLDSSKDRTGTGLLPVHDDGSAPDEYSKLAVAGKLKASNTVLSVGELILPPLPTIRPNDGRLFPQTFAGGFIKSNEIKGLTLTAARLNTVKQRNSTDHSPLTLSLANRRFKGHGATADHFDTAGLSYQFNPQWLGSYHVAQLQDIYRQQVMTLLSKGTLGPGTWASDVRFSLTSDYGAAKGSTIDNQSAQGLFSYALQGHTLGLGYQQMFGETGYAFIHGTDANLINLSILGDFANAKERSWTLRYGYDFAAIGLPGLTINSRYMSGSHAQITGTRTIGKERELDNEVRYTVQQGPIKDLTMRVRSAIYRSNYSRNFPSDMDDVRLMLSYSWIIR